MATCENCIHADGDDCLRDGRYKQAYETKYGDKDFCGPGRRYFTKETPLAKVAKALRAQQPKPEQEGG